MPEVSVIIVCMGGPRKHLEACLAGLKAHTSAPYEVLTVAYRWTPEDKEAFALSHPEVTLIPSDEVRGFSENNNLALPLAKGRYCFILNDDTRIDAPVVDTLLADFEKLPQEAAVVSPCIRFADGRVQTCGRAPWTAWRYARHYLHLVDETRPSRWSMKEGLFQTYTLNGACFLIRTEVFKALGWFDERFFFTPEDIALGHKLNEAGYSVWTDAGVSITHLAGGSVSAMEAAIKPARVRGSLLFYGEPFGLKVFIWCFEALRVAKYAFLPRSPRNDLMKKTARNVMQTVFSKESPKEIFLKFS
jgi:hypothetical protein